MNRTLLSRFKLGFTGQVVTGVLLGIVTGLFFGESISGIGAIGIVYVRLLQMTILPYIVVSLIHGFGGLTREQAVKVAPRLVLVMLVFWCAGLALVMVMPAVFPDRQSAAFFNPSVLELTARPSMVDMFIPANPFAALAAGTIPAVVLFSILFGVALMGLKGTEDILRNMDLITKALTRVTMMVLKITPIGVFAMTAASAGTMDVSEFGRLQVYFTTYIGGCLFLTFAVFPVIVATCTSFSYRQVLREFRAVLIMAFTTGNLFVVLPLMMEKAQALFVEDPELKSGSEYVGILVPVAFNFPNMGKLIGLLFILFGAWFTGAPIAVSAYPSFLATGLATFFGGIDLAVPYMLALTGLPADLFNIYSVTGVINGRFATLLACMELISMTLITGSWLASASGLHIRLRSLMVRTIGVVVLAVLMLISMRLVLELVVPSAEDHAGQLASMDLPFRSNMTVAKPGVSPPQERVTVLGFLSRNTGNAKSLRVGYVPDNLPFSYFNQEDRLVGYDVELISRMASELKWNLEFYPTTMAEMEKHLTGGRLDLVISGVSLSESKIRELGFSDPYETLTLGAVIRKSAKREFEELSPSKVKNAKLKVALGSSNPYLESFRVAAPEAELAFVENPRVFYEDKTEKYDALFCSMEAGSAWNMLYPGFTTLLLRDGELKKELVIATGPDNVELLRYLNDWLRLQENKGTMDMLYNYWIRGEPRENQEKPPRWCIMRNVFHWGGDE